MKYLIILALLISGCSNEEFVHSFDETTVIYGPAHSIEVDCGFWCAEEKYLKATQDIPSIELKFEDLPLY